MNDELLTAVRVREVVQKERIAMKNRLAAIERGVDDATPRAKRYLERWHKRLMEDERVATDDITEFTEDEPIIEIMCNVKGVGKVLAAQVVAMVNIETADTVSSLWAYAGMSVIDGKADRPRKGVKMVGNKQLKKICYLVGTSFLKSKSPYAEVYYSAKEYYEINRPEWTKMHRHYASIRKMVKLWLSHLWVTWRKQKGLPVSQPYAIGVLGHGHYISPQEYGWPA